MAIRCSIQDPDKSGSLTLSLSLFLLTHQDSNLDSAEPKSDVLPLHHGSLVP